MSRRMHRMTRALLALAWTLALVQPAFGSERKGAAPKASPGKRAVKKEASPREAPKPETRSEARPGKQAKLEERKAPERTNRAPTGDERRSAKQPPPAKASAPTAQARSTKQAPPNKAQPTKQVSPAKQSRDKGHERAYAQSPTAAKSVGRVNDAARSRTDGPALKPPGWARPLVRSVSSRLDIPPRAVAEQTAAFRYANLEDAEVIAELDRRGIAWVPASPPLPGVRTPIRLAGPLRGVTIHSTLPEPERRASAFEILDGRLALALDDFCALLARHDVVEIVHYTMYRPPGELPPDLNKQIRHPAGLAIDVGAVRKADGRWLAIGPHWPSDIGAKTCGEGAREHWSRPGREIVSIACEAADLRMFHFILTPHFDAAHADHLHLEIKPDTHWFMVN